MVVQRYFIILFNFLIIYCFNWFCFFFFLFKPNAELLEQAVEELNKKKYNETRNKGRAEQNTPPTVTTVDRNNGSHNAWGGFISRTLPVPEIKLDAQPNQQNKRSRTRSKSRTRSHSPIDEIRTRVSKKSRHRSKTPNKYTKKKSKNYSRSPSSSPQHTKHKKR